MEILVLVAIASAVSALGSFLSRHHAPHSPHGEDERRRRMAAAASGWQWQDAARRRQQQRLHQQWRR